MKGLYFVTFAAGAAIGSVATWKFLKDKYAKEAQEEIASIREVYTRAQEEQREKDRAVAEKARNKADILDIARQKAQDLGYVSTNDTKPDPEAPYVISPEEFGEFDDYEKISLTLYSDGVLADDGDEQIVDIDEIVGEENLKTFGQYEDDSVFVRSDARKCDYEILRDERTFAEVSADKPPRVEVQ